MYVYTEIQQTQILISAMRKNKWGCGVERPSKGREQLCEQSKEEEVSVKKSKMNHEMGKSSAQSRNSIFIKREIFGYNFNNKLFDVISGRKYDSYFLKIYSCCFVEKGLEEAGEDTESHSGGYYKSPNTR